ncbi:MAG: ribosome-associated translation inhibitor RaiA [Planctomycetota bacterium]|nr:ribosome-associated translation inhibitor RaiA [Planctomycetota bacterium]
MKVQIEGRHLKLTPAMHEHVQKKIENLEKYFDGLHNLHILLSPQEPKQQKVEIVAAVVRGKPLVAHAVHEDMYVAVDEAVHKIREHLKKYKDRMRGRKRQSGRFKTPDLGAPEPDTGDETKE